MLSKPSADWVRDDLQWLIDEKIEENGRLDYKENMPLTSPSKRAEAAKDVSALANSSGGRIIVGLAEHEDRGKNVPVDYAPIANVGALRNRLLDALNHYCQPAVGVSCWPIEIENGHCLVIDVPESLAPVMVLGGEHTRYYHRVDTKCLPMNEREVRERYTRLHSRHEAVEQLIREADPRTPNWPSTAADRCQPAWLVFLTVPAFGPVDVFNPALFEIQRLAEFVTKDRSSLISEFTSRLEPRFFGQECMISDAGNPVTLLRLHRSGIIEFHTAVLDGRGYHVPPPGEQQTTRLRLDGLMESRIIMDVLDMSQGLYEKGGYVSDLQVRAYYEGLVGWYCMDHGHVYYINDAPMMHAVDTSVSRLRKDGTRFAKGLLDRVWQAAGVRYCPAVVED